MKRYYLLYCNDLYTINSGIHVPFRCCTKLRDVAKTYLEYLYIIRVPYIPGLQKNLSFVEMCVCGGGGGEGVW